MRQDGRDGERRLLQFTSFRWKKWVEKLRNLKNILILKNTSIGYNQCIFMFTRQTSVWIKMLWCQTLSPQIWERNVRLSYAKRAGSSLCSHLIIAEQLIQFADCGDFKVKLINQNAGGCKVTMLQNIPTLRHFLFLSFKALNMKSRL